MIFYHVSAVPHLSGTVLTPGKWAQQLRPAMCDTPLSVSHRTILFWEVSLETARLALAPTHPSRLNCVFGTPDMASAEKFRDQFRTGSGVFEVSCASDAPIKHGDFDLISSMSEGLPIIETFPSRANDYWTMPVRGLTELLIGADVTVIKRVA